MAIFSVLGAIALVPVIGAAALALDFVGAYLEAEKIQDRLDSAALGSVRAYGEGATEDAASKEGAKFFWSNYTAPASTTAASIGTDTPALSTCRMPPSCNIPATDRPAANASA